ncbi:MAG: FecR domain-containing protein [Candidatus Omnitrophica bacterium]|nr:FecR domain-containing protein [Candidatus Omnitrophota bacterium]
MKRFIIFFILSLLFLSSAFAQSAKIIDLKGRVSVKRMPDAQWEKAKVSTTLEKLAEVKTEAKSECVLVFDEAMKNVLTLKGNSQVKLEDIKPVSVSLPQGKVFALVDDIKAVEKFEIRTPTAVAGVRGTGESVEFNNARSTIKCFRDTVYVQGLDAQGNGIGEAALAEGFGFDVVAGGLLGEAFTLSAQDRNEWSRFERNTEGARREVERTANENRGNAGALEDLKQDRRQDYQDIVTEGERREEESRGRCHSDGCITVCD